ncbi:MAG: hypothetical protein OEO77_00270 [Acidimicrobiia bacterium]|nr:hypothetical protein [Acidimicrobiia bacterium]
MNIFGFGLQRLLRGFREGDQRALALGAGALLLAYLRRPQQRTLLHSERIERGERIVIDLKPRRPTGDD